MKSKFEHYGHPALVVSDGSGEYRVAVPRAVYDYVEVGGVVAIPDHMEEMLHGKDLFWLID